MLQKTSLITLIFLPLHVFAGEGGQWSTWFEQEIQDHPTLQAASAEKSSLYAESKALQKPLYNPELETEYEREGDNNNYRIGLSQQFDIWDKNEQQQALSTVKQQLAERAFILAQQQAQAAGLQAIIEWQLAKQLSVLAEETEQQLEQLQTIIRQRQATGDLGAVDAQMTFLSLSQQFNETVLAKTQLQQAQTKLQQLLPNWDESRTIPSHFWQVLPLSGSITNIDQHPSVIWAHSEWQMQMQNAELSKKQMKADPQFGLNAGKEGEDNVIGLTFSMPLNFRNDYSEQSQSAEYLAIAAKLRYQDQIRQQQLAMQLSHRQAQIYQQQLERWQTLFQSRTKNSKQLLDRQWNNGDITTRDYLLALQQQTETTRSGITLQSSYQQSYVDWLVQSGQLSTAFQELKNK